MRDNWEICKEYADKRKNLNQDEVEDLYRCVVGYLREKCMDEDVYAVKVPRLGYLHRRFDDLEKESTVMTRGKGFYDMFIDLSYNPRVSPYKENPLVRESLLERLYPNKEIQEISDFQNSIE